MRRNRPSCRFVLGAAGIADNHHLPFVAGLRLASERRVGKRDVQHPLAGIELRSYTCAAVPFDISVRRIPYGSRRRNRQLSANAIAGIDEKLYRGGAPVVAVVDFRAAIERCVLLDAFGKNPERFRRTINLEAGLLRLVPLTNSPTPSLTNSLTPPKYSAMNSQTQKPKENT